MENISFFFFQYEIKNQEYGQLSFCVDTPMPWREYKLSTASKWFYMENYRKNSPIAHTSTFNQCDLSETAI